MDLQTKISYFPSVYQKLSLALDIMSDAVEVHIGHFSSYNFIRHFTYQMINNCHGTLDIMSDFFCIYVGHSG